MVHARWTMSRFVQPRERLSVKEKVEFTRFPTASTMLGSLGGFTSRRSGLEFKIMNLVLLTDLVESVLARPRFFLENGSCGCRHWLKAPCILLVSSRHFNIVDWLKALYSFLEILSLDCHHNLWLLK